jgi:hypothetical protein
MGEHTLWEAFCLLVGITLYWYIVVNLDAGNKSFQDEFTKWLEHIGVVLP